MCSAFGSNRIEHMQPIEKIVSRSRPLEGIVALNVDGSVFSNVSVGGFRGLIRDHRGDFLHGYYGSSGGSCVLFMPRSQVFFIDSNCVGISVIERLHASQMQLM
ncbi:hypothetical protein P8452_19027 [Trifolium repens]|nr:hypothetical protein P8452_19027 [Trifolium repens]